MSYDDQIKKSLMALMDAIRRADAAAVAAETQALDRCLDAAGEGLHPQLAHFLRNRSYPKALMFLGGEAAIPGGSCGRKGPGA
jgi:hypothetical protein